MIEQKPFFSIIIPTYNRADFIAKTIESVLAQTYTNFEIIVVDDGSTDNTEAVINQLNCSKLSYYKKNNGERGAARNFGIQKAQGEYITFLDSDDLLYPNHFAEAINLIQANKQALFFSLAYQIIDNQGVILHQNNQRKGDLNQALITGNHLSCIGVFVQQVIMKQNLFNEDRKLAGTEDWEVWMRLASRYKIYYSNTITSAIVNHESRSVLNASEENLKNRMESAIYYLKQDAPFVEKYGKSLFRIQSHLNLYIALHLLLAKQKKRGWYYAKLALWQHPPVFFNKKFLVLLRELLK